MLMLIMNYSYKVLEIQKSGNKPSRYIDFYINCVKLLCLLGTVKTTKYYIPGETNIAERLRKYAFDSGIFSILVHMHAELKTSSPFLELKNHIKTKVLNMLELSDLQYHIKIINAVNNNIKKKGSDKG